MPTVSINGTAYEVYDTKAGVDIYMDARLGADAWGTVSTQEKLMVTATRMLDRMLWQGQKTSAVQALAHPRTGMTDRDGNAVDSATIHADVLSGFYELCLALAEDEAIQDKAKAGGNNPNNIKRVKAGSVEVEYFSENPSNQKALPEVVSDYLSQFLTGYGGDISLPVATGTDQVSSFDSLSPFDLNDPLA